MTFAKASALALGFVGSVALGVWIGPYVRDGAESIVADRPATAMARPAATSAQPASSSPSIATSGRTVTAPATPELHKRLRPILNKGTDPTIAAAGFRDAEQFATVAHAARNTGTPFMVLKHRVLEQHKSLTAAIHELKPEVDAQAEVNRARAMARSDVAAISG